MTHHPDNGGSELLWRRRSLSTTLHGETAIFILVVVRTWNLICSVYLDASELDPEVGFCGDVDKTLDFVTRSSVNVRGARHGPLLVGGAAYRSVNQRFRSPRGQVADGRDPLCAASLLLCGPLKKLRWQIFRLSDFQCKTVQSCTTVTSHKTWLLIRNE
jgi:hypothetical protein